ncbi:MAG TPA: hypothetical protein GX506_11150 [Firmicutes bacterium]|nr:hypothetical protein [Bacillota bacterium]
MRGIPVVCSILVVALCLLPVAASGQEGSTLLSNLSRAEMLLYGRESTGSIMARLSQMEQDLFGKEQQGSIIDRAAKLNAFVGESLREGPSLAFKLASLEWTLMRSVSQEPLVLKVDRLERLVSGVTSQGSIVSRVEGLIRLCMPQGKVTSSVVKVPAGTAVKIKLLNGFTSANAKKGDRIEYEVSRDVIVGTEVAIPRGARGVAVVKNVQPAGRLGRDGRVELEIGDVRAFDGTMVKVGLSEDVKRMNESLQLAVGASVAGFVIFGPIGALGGFLVEGKDAIVAAGTEMFVAVQKDTEVLGLTFPGGAEVPSFDIPVVEIKPPAPHNQ